MKTIVIYASKYGAAGNIAQCIADKIDGAVIHDLKQGFPSISNFDCIIFGSSVYAGMIRKEAKEFMRQNTNALLEKKLGLFLCGIGAEGEKTYFESNFSKNILQKTIVASFLGGIFDPKKAGLIERLIIKAATKQSGYTNTIDNNKIEQLVEAIKKIG